jgi:hypothetical protein
LPQSTHHRVGHALIHIEPDLCHPACSA